MSTPQNHKAAQRAAAAVLGAITSAKKAAAARRNGRLGGRPSLRELLSEAIGLLERDAPEGCRTAEFCSRARSALGGRPRQRQQTNQTKKENINERREPSHNYSLKT